MKNIVKSIILLLIVVVGMLFLCLDYDSVNTKQAIYLFVGFIAYLSFTYIITTKSNLFKK